MLGRIGLNGQMADPGRNLLLIGKNRCGLKSKMK
jgi:hypothetical protein